MIKHFVKLSILLTLLIGCASPTTKAIPEENSVFYEIFVASFYDSDGDGRGDLQGVIEKLDYVQHDLGATGIWLMPIHPSRSYHKYDVMDYKDIDPAYGTMADMEALIKEMEDRNMDLIIDLVINHSSNEHPWFLEAVEEFKNDACIKYCDYYTLSKTAEPGYHLKYKDLYYAGNFADTMPELNLSNPEVKKEIFDIVKFWVDKGVSGFRLDATTHYFEDNSEQNINFIKEFSDYAYSLDPDLYIVGEAWKNSSIILPMYASNISFFNFDVAQNKGQLVRSINNQKGHSLANYIMNYNEQIRAYNPNGKDAIFFSNHDQGRSASYFANQIEKQKLAASTYLLMPGNVFIYYGEEIGMIGSGRDENKRLAMPWGEAKGMTLDPQNSDYEKELEMDVKSEQANKDSLFNHYQKVINTRHTFPSISREQGISVKLDDEALFAMQFDDIIVVHNFSSERLTITGDYHIEDNSLGGKARNGSIELDGYQTVILSKSK
ncbi:MAG: alpha-amylase [Erysipelothrix sp.]|nr:alpha-amylase [Erysipelothrix sp.]